MQKGLEFVNPYRHITIYDCNNVLSESKSLGS